MFSLLWETQLSVTRFVLICYICRVQQTLHPWLIYYILCLCCPEIFLRHILQAFISFGKALDLVWTTGGGGGGGLGVGAGFLFFC
jgi:hypothetical protein